MRAGKKVKHHVVANRSDCPPQDIAARERALHHRCKPAAVGRRGMITCVQQDDMGAYRMSYICALNTPHIVHLLGEERPLFLRNVR